MSGTVKKILRAGGALVFWIGLWAIISLKINRAVLVPSPASVLRRLLELLAEKSFYITVSQSLVTILAGFVLGTVFAVLAAVLCHLSKTADAIISPALTVIKSTPVASFIILALVFIGKRYVPALICFMMVSPVVFGSVTNGISLRNGDCLEMLGAFRINPMRKLAVFDIPSILPFLGEGCCTALGLAWKAGIAAEVLCTPQDTIGLKLYESKVYLETTDVFCWTLVVIILSLVLEKLLKAFVSRSKRRRGGTAQ